MSLLLNIPRSTVSGIITKWKQLGTTETQCGNNSHNVVSHEKLQSRVSAC
ncbi:unnamed protein product [Staurois parvus]|uniref:Transposase n=1 Tax=Staurois parvus TaxID=386267 RepID=A0ABN9DDB4_9NEOB|nr:unnamed protein product [Staurois parvus]